MKWFDKTKNKITHVDITLFLHQLYTLLRAGIPLVQSCEILSEGQTKVKLKQLIIAIKQQLEEGRNFSQTLSVFPDIFDDLCCQLIYLGEQSGSLDIILNKIVNNREKKSFLTQKIKQTLLYPCFVIILALSISLIMLIGIVPHFAELFQDFHHPLPFLTRTIFFLSKILQNFSGILGLILISILSPIYYYRNKFASIFPTEKIPFIGKFLIKICLVQFCQNLSLLITSGINLDQSLKLLSTHSSSLVAPTILQVQRKIHTGQSLHLTMRSLPIFPHLMVEMVKTGEEAGLLDSMLLKVAQFYEVEIDHFLHQLGQLLEPLIMVVLGVLIGGLVIALYLPIFNLGTAF